MMAADFPDRREMLAKVHIARKDLGIDDDTYRDVLTRVTGRTSSADCTRSQIVDLLDEF
jgi:phage gp16-like protein